MTDGEMAKLVTVMTDAKNAQVTRIKGDHWKVDLETPRYAVNLIEDNIHFEYCHIEVGNEDETGYYREVILQSANVDGRHVIIEGVYQRPLGERGDAGATFEGTVMIGHARDQEVDLKRMRHSFGERIAEEYVTQTSYVADGLRTAAHYLDGKATDETMRRLMEQVARLNRTIADMGGSRRCSST